MSSCPQFSLLIGSFSQLKLLCSKLFLTFQLWIEDRSHSGMFGLSAAFDSVDHAILHKRLDDSFSIRGNAVNWIASYLSGMSQQVSVHGILASSFYLVFGMPQRSVLGPVLFLLHTADLVALVPGFGLSAHVFADDLQVYCHFLDGEEQVALQLFRDCSEYVSRWMSSNRLKLNPLKTELIWLHISRRNPTFLRKDIVLFAGASFQLFLGGAKFFFIFQCHRTIEKLEKTALYM